MCVERNIMIHRFIERLGHTDQCLHRPVVCHDTRQDDLGGVPMQTHQTEIAEKNHDTSPLLCLPPEIRNIIWKQVLGNKTFEAHSCEEHGICIWTHPTTAGNLSLLLTCHQVYSEAILFLYQENIFDITPALTGRGKSEPLCGLKGLFLQNIKQVEINIDLFVTKQFWPVEVEWMNKLPGLCQVFFTLKFQRAAYPEYNLEYMVMRGLRRFTEGYCRYGRTHDRKTEFMIRLYGAPKIMQAWLSSDWKKRMLMEEEAKRRYESGPGYFDPLHWWI
ncbi:hypothetical protein DM02DRAFT_687498 [Periconia macrospinosa]|uniref:DUF7730 domain-containing protein n=1 Tax=Periconia macrospinosa TaxID=97972 RepID=A0A2V1DEN4_9PLEO|nr:hypothetical protein DM02DRAFT_687498 [Periconia macrospinosa]